MIKRDKFYTTTGKYLEELQTRNATEAMHWHRAGKRVAIYSDNNPRRPLAVIDGARTPEPRDENRDYCRRIADELEAYANDDVKRCPNCGEIHARDWSDVGDKFKCPHCGDVSEVDGWEWLGLSDYLADVLDYDFRIDSQREYSAVRVYVTLGGPSCWIDTERGTVELRWGSETACFGLLSDTVDAVDDYFREIWDMGQ